VFLIVSVLIFPCAFGGFDGIGSVFQYFTLGSYINGAFQELNASVLWNGNLEVVNAFHSLRILRASQNHGDGHFNFSTFPDTQKPTDDGENPHFLRRGVFVDFSSPHHLTGLTV